jgi:Fur family transcriptional regulator, peroxide stress response regulator
MKAVSSPEARIARFRELTARHGLRMTPQRTVLLSVLGRMRHHPTADELYRRVQKILPSLSPATVYRNVQILVRAGVISTLERAGDAVRYDSNPDEHHHFICNRCGRVVDVYLSSVDYRVDAMNSSLDGAQIESCAVQLRGVCPQCG